MAMEKGRTGGWRRSREHEGMLPSPTVRCSFVLAASIDWRCNRPLISGIAHQIEKAEVFQIEVHLNRLIAEKFLAESAAAVIGFDENWNFE
jgi:hypothetical protein